MTIEVVAISGWKRSGKDTMASHLVATHGYHQVSLATALKDFCIRQYSLTSEQCHDQKLKETALIQFPVTAEDQTTVRLIAAWVQEFRTLQGRKTDFAHSSPEGMLLADDGSQLYWTPRAIMISEGAAKRAVDKNYWVKRAVDEIIRSGRNHIVISDLRFKSEIRSLHQALEDAGQRFKLTTVRVNRFEQPQSTDPSERDLDTFNFDVVVDNSSDLFKSYARLEQGLGLTSCH